MKPLELVPFQRVGPFEFNKSIKLYQDYDFKFSKCDDKTEWDLYSYEEDGIDIYTEEDLIVSISCRKTLMYNGLNIIGLELESFLQESNFTITKDNIDKIYMPDIDAYQDVIDLDDIGIQLWSKEDIIVTVFCSPDVK